jgi:hypothetical protein
VKNPEDEVKDMAHKPKDHKLRKQIKHGTSKGKRGSSLKEFATKKGGKKRLKKGHATYTGKNRLGGRKRI